MEKSRLDTERLVLERHLPCNAFRFVDLDTDTPHILMAVKTRRDNNYILRIDLNGFPEECPEMYVTKMLCDWNGKELREEQSDLFVLPSKYGYTHISHFSPECWDSHVSIFRVYLAGNLWLNAYELYLETGETYKDYRKNE